MKGSSTLKNGGYEMEHKYSRVSYQASKNYYQLMQMAHLVNQLMILSTHFQEANFSGKKSPNTQKSVAKPNGCNEVGRVR